MAAVFLIRVVTFSCEIYAEDYIITDAVFGSKEDAELYILENKLLDQGECEVIESNLKGKLCLNLL